MSETSLSLLQNLRDASDELAWDRMHRIYTPLLKAWLRKYNVQDSDVQDLSQDVLLAISREIAVFEHNGRTGAFRAWVRGIMVNRLRTYWRARPRRTVGSDDSEFEYRLAQLDDPASDLSQVWNREHDQHVLRALLKLVESEFEPQTWQAFQMVTFDGLEGKAAGEKLGISRNAVFVAKSRVLSRLRQVASGMIDSDSEFSGLR